jgi:hypothetical protein
MINRAAYRPGLTPPEHLHYALPFKHRHAKLKTHLTQLHNINM